MKFLLKENIIYEGVLSTIYNSKPYIGAVGFVKKGNFIEIKVYKNNMLHTIVKETSRFVLNITYDPLTLVYSAFKKYFNVNDLVEREVIYRDDLVFLKNALAYMILEKVYEEELEEFSLIKFRIHSLEVNEDSILEPLTRCYSNLVEIAIYVSKIVSVRNLTEKLFKEYCRYIDNSLTIIMKTCSEEYKQVANKLIELIRIGGSQNNY